MYEKRFVNKRLMYFAYAPPMTVLDNITDPDRPNPPYPNAQLWERSVYYYWWLFLRENADYWETCENNGIGPCCDLYLDFGDIRGDDFMTWWIAGGRDLFKEPEDEGVRVMIFDTQEHRPENNILLSIPFNGDLDRTLREIRALLAPEFAKLRIKKGASQALYPVAAKPVLSTLHRRWRIWKMRQENPDMRGAEIYHRLLAAGDVQLQNQETDSEKASFIARSYREAQALIKYVGLGYFPVLKEADYQKLLQAGEELEPRLGFRARHSIRERRKRHR